MHVSAQDISVFAACLAAALSLTQVFLARRAAHGQLLRSIVELMNQPEQRENRARLYALACTPLDDWRADDYAVAERVGGLFNQAGSMMCDGYISRRALDVWGKSITDCYKITEPLIERRRELENNPSIFFHYEWLARQSILRQASELEPLRRPHLRLKRRTDKKLACYEVELIQSTRPTTRPVVVSEAAAPPTSPCRT